MIEAILQAVSALSDPVVLFYILLGAAIGMLFGALPGLGGTIALALLLPVTFGMRQEFAMVLLAATLGGVAFGGSVSAILINVPGTGPNAATLLDGYPMSKQGLAGRALGISATASALGAIFGLVIFLIILPVSREIILAFQPPEFFWLAIFGLTIIAVVTKGSIYKGLVSGGIGLMIAQIGYVGATGDYRFGFGTLYLYDGVHLIVAIIGIFAIAEIIHLSTTGGAIAKAEVTAENRSSPISGMMYVLRHPSLFFRSAAIGTIIGIVPGAGGSVATFVSYMQAVQTSNDPESFGRGNPAGVLAAEAANDSKDGGALLPTLVFGIPGSPGWAIILGGLTIHGLTPGRQLLSDDLGIVFLIVFALLFSNVFTSVAGLLAANALTKLTHIDVKVLSGPILVISLVGAFALRGIYGDVVTAIVFGIIGYWMIVFDYSRVALILALILGPIAEKAFLQSRMISDVGYWIFVTRPISAVLILLTLLSLLIPIIRDRFQTGGIEVP